MAEKLNKCQYTEDLMYDIWLDRLEGVPVREKRELARRFGGGSGVFQADVDEISFTVTGKTLREHPKGKLWTKIFSKDTGAAEKQLEYMARKKIAAISLNSGCYPEMLRHISDPPWILYYRGNARSWESPGMAIVGARKSTEYGKWAAFELGRKLGRAGVTVVSGMAYGVDACAHRGALEGAEAVGTNVEANTATIAVFGCGVDVCYPRSHARLMEQIIERGAVLSELPPGTEPKPYFFPRRNRIISGLSRGVVIAEAGLRSGSLITAELAAEQGREVYAIPGNINRPSSIGTNKLIRDGAVPIVVLDDVLTELGLISEEFTKIIHNQLGNDERKIYNEILQCGEIRMDQLSVKLDISVGKVSALVTVLEMKGILQTAMGKIFIAKI